MNLNYLNQIEKADVENMTFKQIFALYDKNFEYMSDFLHEMGAYSTVETFTNVQNNTVTLSKGFIPGRNQLVVYVNNAIQWVNEGYKEKSSSKIEFNFDIDSKDVVKVITITSWSIKDCYEKYNDLLERVRALEGAIQNGVIRVTQAQYDELEGDNRLLPDVMYIIIDSE